ncbi:hypothetical protein [Streptomyces spongiicola]|uniref:hypothetical protein n=1 Tax=Streptomyces spongiicola TaxID=1690221 RepID=UPI0035A65D3B
MRPAARVARLPLRVEHHGRALPYVPSISTFDAPMDVNVAEPAVGTLLPAGPATVDYPRSLTP